MLELKNIVKVYPSGGENIRALRGVSLQFRNNEFVSILGPSGCGKTTMLNIIGGLDQYTEGDLLINGRSTREYKDRDWDNYRNHTIGFVFQSYNLIPHQTVLSNVELALTLSGVSKKERRERAKRALEAVGLGSQLKKRPAQMSGGQMQRVAIARAIVNDPDIILADEPTGALDSETGIQVMNLLQEIARDRLVVMVTHNPELAEQYSTRIIRMLDGAPVADSAPISESELAALRAEDALINQYGSRKAALAAAEAAAGAATSALSAGAAADAGAAAVTGSAEKVISPSAKQPDGKRASMSFGTAFGLSLNNLFTKKGRTLLTAFAGSIGIIGIALIYAVSQGTSNYIDTVQEDTLSSYPLTITTEAADYSAMISGFVSSTKAAEEDRQDNTVIEQPIISSMFSGIGTNDLGALKKHLDANADTLQRDVVAIQYSYGLTPQIYTIDINGELLQANPAKISSYMSMGSAYSAYGMSLFSEMAMPGEQTKEQYDLLAGRWPEHYDEMLLVLGSPGKVSDMLTYSVGLHDPNELTDMITSVMNGESPKVEEVTALSWTYDELLALDFRLIPATARYRYDASHRVWEDMSGESEYMGRLYETALPLKVTGIVTGRSGSNASTLSVGFNYLTDLTSYMMETSAETDIVRAQLADREVNVFSGKPFGEEDSESGLDFSEMIHVDEEALASAFNLNINTSALTNQLSGYMKKLLSNVSADTSGASADFTKVFSTLAKDMLRQYIASNGSGGTATITLNDTQRVASAYMGSASAEKLLATLTKTYSIDASTLKEAYTPLLSAMLTQYITGYSGGEATTQAAAHVVNSTLRAPALSQLLLDDGTETPGTDAPSTDEPGTDTPGTDTPGTDEPGTDNPGSDTPGTDNPGTEEPDTPEVPGVNPEEIINGLMNTPVPITSGQVDGIVSSFASGSLVSSTASVMGARMLAPQLQAMLKKSLTSYASSMFRGLMSSLSVDEEAIANAFGFDMTEADMVRLITALSGGSGSKTSAAENLRSLGYADPEVPDTIYIYLKDFEAKDRFIDFLEAYNESVDEEQTIRYTDITGVLMSSVTTIINAVTYVLIAFVAISLIVSSIMIGVITLISVQERTKEIGILRAIGASKRNVSGMFNAETMIIGFSSGLIGVVVTYLLCIPINLILHKLTGISYLSAKLPFGVAVILVLISTCLTLIAGIIPSRSAAKKDPVVALRTE